MKIKNALTYHWKVNGVGRAGLRVNRLLRKLNPKIPKNWPSDYLEPPLKISARAKELIAYHYLQGQTLAVNPCRKVAWVTSGGPVEILKALGFYTYYPENHAALCGAVRAADGIIAEAEDAGFSQDLCAYFRVDVGSVLSGKTPAGRIPRPDLLLACTNICQTVLYWYRFLEHHFGVPLILIDTPFVYDEIQEHDVEYVQRQLEDAVPVAERVAGKSLKMKKLKNVMCMSKTAAELWHEILERAKHRPSPISVFDAFTQMAPIVDMRGDACAVDFYSAMLEEVDARIAKGIGALKNEKKRLLWDNLPVWFALRFIAETLGSRGVALVASPYTYAWGELAPLIQPDRPFESSALAYISAYLNRSTLHKFKTIQRMVKEYELDGVILHSNRSCKPYSIGLINQRNAFIKQGISAILLDADQCDSRAFTQARVKILLETFIEQLGV